MNISHLPSYCGFRVIRHILQCDMPLSVLHSWYLIIYPHQGAISSINAPYVRPGWWRMCASLYLGPHSRRVLNFTISGSILSHIEPHISEYSRFRLNLRCEAIRRVADHASANKIRQKIILKEWNDAYTPNKSELTCISSPYPHSKAPFKASYEGRIPRLNWQCKWQMDSSSLTSRIHGPRHWPWYTLAPFPSQH